MIKSALPESEQKNHRELLDKFYEIVFDKKGTMDWEKIFRTMDDLRNGLYSKIRSRYPQLNDIEFRVCCLTCENLHDKAIEAILGLTLNMVRRTRSDVRKELGMDKGEDFLTFFEKTIH